jgi:hypothetical protein
MSIADGMVITPAKCIITSDGVKLRPSGVMKIFLEHFDDVKITGC